MSLRSTDYTPASRIKAAPSMRCDAICFEDVSNEDSMFLPVPQSKITGETLRFHFVNVSSLLNARVQS